MFSLLLHGVRSWKNAKGIAVFCIAALTIGIGSSTAIYTVIHAVLLNPLPYSNPERYFWCIAAGTPIPSGRPSTLIRPRWRRRSAGHNPPFLLRADGSIEELAAGGAIIGMFPSLRYEEAAIELHPGDVLLAFSDGVPEAHDPAEEEFGEDRLKALLRRVGRLPVSELCRFRAATGMERLFFPHSAPCAPRLEPRDPCPSGVMI